jgi:hypothetical protein
MTTIEYENKRERKNQTKSQLNHSNQEISMQTVKKAIKNHSLESKRNFDRRTHELGRRKTQKGRT